MTILPFSFVGAPIRSFDWAGARFNAVIRPNHREIDRRHAVGLTAVTDVSVLRACTWLPVGMKVSWDVVDPVAAAILDCAPPGVIQRSPLWVRRVLAPPVSLVGIYLVARSWRDLGRVGFMSFAAPTGIVSTRRPRDLEGAKRLAERAGLGLSIKREDCEEIVTMPKYRTRPTLVRDLLIERLFATWLQGAVTPSARVQAVNCRDSVCTE